MQAGTILSFSYKSPDLGRVKVKEQLNFSGDIDNKEE